MPRGFAGKSVERFFSNTEGALEKAAGAHNRNPFEGMSSMRVPFPSIPTPRNIGAPFEPSEAWTGAPHSSRAGMPGNLVSDPGVVDRAVRQTESADYNAGSGVNEICDAIDTMCDSIFVIPETSQRVKEATARLKETLGTFNSLTEETNATMKSFSREISTLDLGNNAETAFSRQAADQAISRVSSSIDRQINAMKNTEESYRNASARILSHR